jgi:hypothetical protein
MMLSTAHALRVTQRELHNFEARRIIDQAETPFRSDQFVDVIDVLGE